MLGWNENLQPHGPLLDQFDTTGLRCIHESLKSDHSRTNPVIWFSRVSCECATVDPIKSQSLLKDMWETLSSTVRLTILTMIPFIKALKGKEYVL